MDFESFDKRINDVIMLGIINTFSSVISGGISALCTNIISMIKRTYGYVIRKYLDLVYGKRYTFTNEIFSNEKTRPMGMREFIKYLEKNYGFRSTRLYRNKKFITTDDTVLGNKYIGIKCESKIDETIKDPNKCMRNAMKFYSRLHTYDDFFKLCNDLIDKASRIKHDCCILSSANSINNNVCKLYEFDEMIDNPFHVECIENISKLIENRDGANILMYGPPGTGKTSIIKYIAKKYNAVMILCRLQDYDNIESFRCFLNNDSFICVSASNGKQYTVKPKKKFYVFEDFDTMLPKSFWSGEEEPVQTDDPTKVKLAFSKYRYSDLLNLLDGIIKNKTAYMFFTTNHIEKIGNAFCRPGRMHLKTYVGDMTSKSTAAFIKEKYDKIVDESMITRNASVAELYTLFGMCNSHEDFIAKLNSNYYEMLGKTVF